MAARFSNLVILAAAATAPALASEGAAGSVCPRLFWDRIRAGGQTPA